MQKTLELQSSGISSKSGQRDYFYNVSFSGACKQFKQVTKQLLAGRNFDIEIEDSCKSYQYELKNMTIELPDYDSNDGSTVTKRVWENGDSCVSVIEFRVNGGEHDWPGSFGNMDINSDDEIWDFGKKVKLKFNIANTTETAYDWDDHKKNKNL